MTKTLRIGNRSTATKRDPQSVRPWEIGTIIRAVNLDGSLRDLAEVIQVVQCTALDPTIIQGVRWEDVHFEDRHLIVRSARTLHTLGISVPAPVMNMLSSRRQRHPHTEFIFSSECLRHSEEKLGELAQQLLGRVLTLQDVRDAGLKGWGRFDPKALV